MNHVRNQFDVWGTVVDIDIASMIISEIELNKALEKVIEFCNTVDVDFSTYK